MTWQPTDLSFNESSLEMRFERLARLQFHYSGKHLRFANAAVQGILRRCDRFH